MQLLVLEVNEPFGPFVSATLRTVGHDVTTVTTLAALVEALMRDGSRFEHVIINTAHDAQLLGDAARYAHWYAPAASLVALGGSDSVSLTLPFPVATVLDLSVEAAKRPAL
jgi:hypothetical protein